MRENSLMIRIENVKKQYRLGQIGGGTLRGDLQSWWARKRGKEDPNTLIGTDQRLIGTTFMALNGVSFTVNKGEAVGIIGSNGAGKSTFLKLLSGELDSTKGTISIKPGLRMSVLKQDQNAYDAYNVMDLSLIHI